MLILNGEHLATIEHNERLKSIGASIAGMAVTKTLYVSPNGTSQDGLTIATAYQTIQEALDAASTDGDDLTLILISPHSTNYDINTTGDPSWSANVVLMGSFRNWAKIKNTHASASSIMKLTGKVGIYNLNFNLGSGSGNGIILTHGGYSLDCCQFVGEDLTGAATAIHIDGATTIKHGCISNVHIDGHITHMKGILLDNAKHNHLEHLHIAECLTGIQIINSNSDGNIFEEVYIGNCALGIDIDAGNGQHFHDIDFYNCIRNIDDEVGDHQYLRVFDNFEISLYPDNFTGTTVNAHANPDTWGADTELLSAASRDNPFRIIGIQVEGSAAEKFRIRFSSDSGTTHYDDVHVEGEVNALKRQIIAAPSGTEFIFNKGTRISASVKSESGGNSVVIWLEIQEI